MPNPYDTLSQNPYLPAQAQAISDQANQNLNLNLIPGINSDAVAAGGYGGSRNQLAQGVATGLTNQGVAQSVAGLYGNAWQQQQQNQIARQGLQNQFALGVGGLGVQSQGQQNQFALGVGGLGLQSQGLQNQYNLGLGGLGLQNQLQNYNFYTQQRGLDQSGAALGANLYNQGNQGYLGQASGISNIGATQQAAPWQTLGQASNLFNQYTGLGGSAVQTQQGNALGAAVGGGLAGAQIGANLGLGANPYTTPSSTGSYANPVGSTYDYTANGGWYGAGP